MRRYFEVPSHFSTCCCQNHFASTYPDVSIVHAVSGCFLGYSVVYCSLINVRGMCTPGYVFNVSTYKQLATGSILKLFEVCGPSGGLRGGGVPGACPPYSPKFSQFHAVFCKIWQNHMFAPPWRVGAPSYGESCIRPCPTIYHCILW